MPRVIGYFIGVYVVVQWQEDWGSRQRSGRGVAPEVELPAWRLKPPPSWAFLLPAGRVGEAIRWFTRDARPCIGKIAKAAEYPCGKRLAQMSELWLPHYEARHGKLRTGLRNRVLKISAERRDRGFLEADSVAH